MTTLYPYQRHGVKAIDRFGGRCLLADSMGLGKSVQVLTWMQQHPEVRPTIIVCPGSLKGHWRKEASTHTGMMVEVLEGTQPRKFGFGVKSPIYAINYEVLGTWLPHLLALKPKLLVFDEGHYLKNMNALRTQHATILAEGVKHIIVVTGTPITNRPADLWPLLHIIRPELYRNFESYAFEFCAPKKEFGRWQYTGSANMGVLHARLHKQVMIRRRKEDVLKDLPEQTRIVVPVKIPPKEREEYDKQYAVFRGWLQKKGSNPSGADRNHAFGELTKLRVLCGKIKIPAVLDWIESFHQNDDGKLITFVIHRGMSKAILEKYGKQAVLVDGNVPTSKRQVLFEKFAQDKKCLDFVGNIQAAGVGWNGTAASNTLFTELDWRPGIHKQAEDRTHRIGQKNASFNYYLIVQDSIEERILKRIQEKQEIINQAVDGMNAVGSVDNIFDDLVRAIWKGTP